MSSTSEIIEKLHKGELESPSLLADYLVQLSATLMTAGGFELEARVAWAKKWLELKAQTLPDGKSKTDKMIEMESMITDEYKEWQRMAIANRAILETIRSLKKKLSALQSEMTL